MYHPIPIEPSETGIFNQASLYCLLVSLPGLGFDYCDYLSISLEMLIVPM